MKEKSNQYIIFISVLLALIIVSFFWGYSLGSKRTIKTEKYIFINDTINVKLKPKIIFLDTSKIFIDTFYVNNDSSVYIAEIDTTFKDSLYLNVKYYSPPINLFDISYRLPQRLIVKEELQIIKEKHNKFSFSIGSGIMLGSKGLDAGVYLGISYNLFSF